MIFVTVGTGKFERLVKVADELAKRVKEKVIIQKGSSVCDVKNAECFEFSSDFDKYVEKADIIISHGGAGTIFSLMGKGKKVIGVANLNRIDRHQEEILEELDKQENLIYCKDFNLLRDVKKIKNIKLKKYKKPGFWIDRKIEEFLG